MSATDTGKPAVPVAIKSTQQQDTAGSGGGTEDEDDPPAPIQRDTCIDIYGNSPFMQHFLLTHNCFPPSAQKSARINFAAYYAALPNSAVLASDSVQINDALLQKYSELANKTSKHIAGTRKYAKEVREKLQEHRDSVLQPTAAHDFSSRIVSIVAQREQQQRKDLAQQLGRRAVSGQPASGAKARGSNGSKGSKGGRKPGLKVEGEAGSGPPGLVNTIKIPGLSESPSEAAESAGAAGGGGGGNTSVAAAESKLAPMELPKAFGEAQASEARAKKASRDSRWTNERRSAKDAQVDVIYPLNPRDR